MGPMAPPGRSPDSELLCGRNAVREALRAHRRRIRRVLVAEGALDRGTLADIQRLAQQRQIPLERVPRGDLDRLAKGLEHQGALAEASAYPYVSVDELLAIGTERQEASFLLALDALQDPQNVGSLLRTAEAVGIHGVVIPERRAVGITPAVSRASAGAAEHLRVAQVTNLSRTLAALKERGVWIVGVEDLPTARDYTEVALDMPVVLVLGSEGEGLRRLVAEHCDLLLRLPMRGQINSLNVATAGAVILYHAWRTRTVFRPRA